MKIGATISPALLRLLQKKSIKVDYVEVNGDDEIETLRAGLAYSPALLHDISGRFWLNYADPFDETDLARARAMLDLARPPWHSTGIGASAEPQGHTTPYWRGAPAEALQDRTTCLGNIVRNGKRLADWLGIPLLLENYNYHPTNAYEYVCEPDTFRRLVEEIGCEVLLDLAHAQISAFNLGWSSPREYLSALPLDKVREIHLNHPYNDAGKQMLDRHLPLQPADLDLLAWTLDHATRVEALTLESEPSGEEGLAAEIGLLRQAVR